jgi:hypothetical protein
MTFLMSFFDDFLDEFLDDFCVLQLVLSYTSEMLLLEIKENHHQIYGTYDFIYFPMDSKVCYILFQLAT